MESSHDAVILRACPRDSTCNILRDKKEASEVKPINQSHVNCLKSKSVYDTRKPHLIYPEEVSPIFPFHRVN